MARQAWSRPKGNSIRERERERENETTHVSPSLFAHGASLVELEAALLHTQPTSPVLLFLAKLVWQAQGCGHTRRVHGRAVGRTPQPTRLTATVRSYPNRFDAPRPQRVPVSYSASIATSRACLFSMVPAIRKDPISVCCATTNSK